MEVDVVDSSKPGDSGYACQKPEQRRKRRKLLIINLFLDFSKNTTLHGLRYITEAGLTAAEKIFWIITFLISVILCLLLIERVWHKWWFNPVIVSFSERMVHVTEVPFPSVTICPQWKFLSNKKSPYNYSIAYEKYFETGIPKRGLNSPEDQKQKEKLEDVSLICKDVALPFTNRTMSNESAVKHFYEEHVLTPDLDFELAESPEQRDNLCNSFYDGFKIYLQHPDDMPQASLYYYAAIRGQVTSLAIKFSVFNTSKSLEGYTAEQRQCYFEGDRELQYFKTYTYNNCRLECLSLYTYKKCGCVWFHMPHSNSSEICTARKSECVIAAQAELASNDLSHDMRDKCACLPRCESIQYDAEVLKTNYDYKRARAAYLRSIGWNKTDPVDDNRYIFSRIQLYFKEPQCVAMLRSELFGLTDFLANCGGLLGLFLGFSFLSLVEVFYFCTLRLWCTVKKDINSEEKQVSENISQKN